MNPGDDLRTAPRGRVVPASPAPVPAPEVRRFLERQVPDELAESDDALLLRRRNDTAGLAVRGELEEMAAVRDVLIGGVAARRYLPASAGRSGGLGVVWVHGGGWFHGTLDVYDGLARALANLLGAEVVAVDYRLAPEHPFPAGLDDVWTVIGHAIGEFGRIVVAGDSSGANLAAAAALRARDVGIPLAAQLLLYPMLDADETPFKQAYRERYATFAGQAGYGASTYHRIAWLWDTYLPDPALRHAALASPAHAGDLRGVAPAIIVAAEHDILRGEAEAYAARLRHDGVPVEFLGFPGQIHGFLQMRGVFAEASRALELTTTAVRRMLGDPSVLTSRPHP